MRTWERWRALRHHRLQAALSVAALSVAVALPVVLLSVGGGVAAHEIDALERSGFQITVSAGGLHGINSSHALAAQYGRIPSVAAASPVLSAPIDVFPTAGHATPVLAEGILPSAFAATESPEFRGLFPQPLPFSDPTDSGHYANGSYAGPSLQEVMVSTPFAGTFALSVGDTIGLGASENGSGSMPFRVIGEFGTPPASLSPTAVFGVLLPLSDLQILLGVGPAPTVGAPPIDASDTVEIALDAAVATDPGSIARVAAAVTQLTPYYGVSVLSDEAAQLRATTQVLTGFYLALSSVGLAVGLVFLGLVLVRRVETERRTIGIERALGVPSSMVIGEWCRRSLVLGASGSVGGLVAGGVAVGLLARYGSGAAATAAQLARFDPGVLGALVLAVLGLAVMTGLVASRRALRLSIPEALR